MGLGRKIEEIISVYVDEVLDEARLREAEVSLSDGSNVPYASKEHIRDLERRIEELIFWKDKSKRGTDARANYARVISRLKGDLAKAKRHLTKKLSA